jgi:hypothetical protein
LGVRNRAAAVAGEMVTSIFAKLTLKPRTPEGTHYDPFP